MHNKADYKKQLEQWYAKLELEGFQDIETKSGKLKHGTVDRTYAPKPNHPQESSRTAISLEAKQQYYYMATHFLNDHKFDSRFEEIIWEYHANGLSIRNIVATLNKVRKKKTDRQTVWEIIRELELKMKEMYNVK